ncbi:hypothetical protein AVEN_102086-1 [Araneus ventricosus]|uniref:Uncharacterized protein n=1 Tax=Araneus ventricosus TaxID=182803 RepID=A0A4Y1ZRY5_ARAVE|nr:hypothetical protein AVEN_99483-1 [Araneus ventricosus]GBO39167.1 hypothetical protein AVEN_102086-1 [Araneus ventricosus]
MNENLNDELFRNPLAIEVIKLTTFSVKGKIINQKYTLCGLNPVQPQYKKHFEKIRRQRILNENPKDTRLCKIIYPLCRNHDEDKRRQTYKDKGSNKFLNLANLAPSKKKNSN